MKVTFGSFLIFTTVENMMKGLMKKPPLPFQGVKSGWFQHFANIIERIKAIDPAANIVDVFGGSGLLSYWCKHLNPTFNVIYNDFDYYSERLKHINDINILLRMLRKILNVNTDAGRQLTSEEIAAVKGLLSAFNGFMDVSALNSWLMFSSYRAKTVDEILKVKNNFYYRLPANDYDENSVADYLADLKIIHEDARNYNRFQDIIHPLLRKEHITFYILDPPYLYTDKSNYRDAYFSLADTVNLINYFIKEPHFVLFNSDSSGFLELLNELSGALPDVDFSCEIERKQKSIAGKKDGGKVGSNEFCLLRV